MPRAFVRSVTPPPQGEIQVEQISDNIIHVFYVPSKNKLEFHGLETDQEVEHRVKLLRINGHDRSLTIFPTSTSRRDTFLTPKHERIREITLADTDLLLHRGLNDTLPATADDIIDLLEQLPSGFTKDFDYGLGFARDYWHIIDAVEALSDCTEIVISSTHQTGVDEKTRRFFISMSDFERIRKNIDNITALGRMAVRSVRAATSHNMLAEPLGEPAMPIRVGRHPLRRLITAAAQGKLEDADQDELLTLFAENTKRIAEEKPHALARLKADIETVTLRRLIEHFEQKLNQKLKEDAWQAFLGENPFVFHLAFGYPVIKVDDQASVGGTKLSGSGGKIADFVLKNTRTNNTAIVEIKKPSSRLLNESPVRPGVYTPSSELSGSINQVLDQKYHFQKDIATLKNNSRIKNIESYSVHCCLIIGTMPQEDDQIKSFELFRNNSKNVEIVTFDELLEKLKQLHAFLTSAE